MPNDHFTFRRYSDLQIDRDFPVQSHWHGVFANSLQRFAQVYAMSFDLVATLSECFGDVHRSNRTVKRTLLARFASELELERAHLLALCIRTRAFFSFLLQQRRAFRLDAFNEIGRASCRERV